MKTKKTDKPMLARFNLSYSAYSVWKKSPLQFYFQYLSDKEPTDRVNQSYGIIGNIIHKAIEEYIDKKENNFNRLWKEKKADNLVGFYNKKFDKEEHKEYFEKFKILIDELRKKKDTNFFVEKAVMFESKELYGITVKGFMDLILENFPKIFVYDWKTNTRFDQSMHKDQRLFYSYLIYKDLGKVPDNCIWLYIKGGYKFHNDRFKEPDMLSFEQELKKMLDKIKEYGDNISKYPMGDYNNPFNAYKKLCKEEESDRGLKSIAGENGMDFVIKNEK